MQFIEHVAAGCTTASLIWAARNRRSFVLLFTNNPYHFNIHRHNREGHRDHFTNCQQNACGTTATVLATEA